MAYITNPKTPNTHKTHTPPPPPTYHVVFSSYIASTPTNSSI